MDLNPSPKKRARTEPPSPPSPPPPPSSLSPLPPPPWEHTTARELMALQTSEEIREAQQQLEQSFTSATLTRHSAAVNYEGRILYNHCRDELRDAREAIGGGDTDGEDAAESRLMELRDLACTMVAASASMPTAHVEALRAHVHAGLAWLERSATSGASARQRAADAFARAHQCCVAVGGLDAAVRTHELHHQQVQFAEITLLRFMVSSAKCSEQQGRSPHACALLVEAATALTPHSPIVRPTCIAELFALGERLARDGAEWSACITVAREAVRFIEQRDVDAAAEAAAAAGAAGADTDAVPAGAAAAGTTRDQALYLLAVAYKSDGDADNASATLLQVNARSPTYFKLLIECCIAAKKPRDASDAIDKLLVSRTRDVDDERWYRFCKEACVALGAHLGWTQEALRKFDILEQSAPLRRCETRTALVQRLVKVEHAHSVKARSSSSGSGGGGDDDDSAEEHEITRRHAQAQRVVDLLVDDHVQKRCVATKREQRDCADVLWNAALERFERYEEQLEHSPESEGDTHMTAAATAREIDACCFLCKLCLCLASIRPSPPPARSDSSSHEDDAELDAVSKVHRLLALCMLERGDVEGAVTHASAGMELHGTKPSRLVRFAAHIGALCVSTDNSVGAALRRDSLAVTRDTELSTDDVRWCLAIVCKRCDGEAAAPSKLTDALCNLLMHPHAFALPVSSGAAAAAAVISTATAAPAASLSVGPLFALAIKSLRARTRSSAALVSPLDPVHLRLIEHFVAIASTACASARVEPEFIVLAARAAWNFASHQHKCAAAAASGVFDDDARSTTVKLLDACAQLCALPAVASASGIRDLGVRARQCAAVFTIEERAGVNESSMRRAVDYFSDRLRDLTARSDASSHAPDASRNELEMISTVELLVKGALRLQDLPTVRSVVLTASKAVQTPAFFADLNGIILEHSGELKVDALRVEVLQRGLALTMQNSGATDTIGALGFVKQLLDASPSIEDAMRWADQGVQLAYALPQSITAEHDEVLHALAARVFNRGIESWRTNDGAKAEHLMGVALRLIERRATADPSADVMQSGYEMVLSERVSARREIALNFDDEEGGGSNM